MSAENVIGLAIYILVSFIMISIGISQLKSRTPVGFYSGEKPPKEKDLTDVKAWNRKHGLMWLSYGIIIILSYFAAYPFGDSVWCIIPAIGGLIVPIIFMIWYHKKLMKMYLKRGSYN